MAGRLKVLLLILFCFCGFIWSDPVSVAVGQFENRSDRIYLDSWAEKAPEYLRHELSAHPDIVLVERHQLEAILSEQALGMTGLTDSSKAREVGRLISARYIITGTITREDQWVRIDAKVINTTTGTVLTEKVQSKNNSYLSEMVELLGNNLGYQLSGRGAYQSSLKIRKYPATLFLGITLAGGFATGFVHHEYTRQRDEYRSNDRLKSMNDSYNRANRLYKARNILIGVTGAALIGTLYCWWHNQSPEAVMASQPLWMPYAYHQSGETIVGVQFSF